jgi:predicted component of type VI protein secretion system
MGKLGDIDVHAVETLSLKILTEKSKDTRAFAFLAYSALRKNELGRLADVFSALADYCRDSFEQLFPRRDGAKLAALRWLSEPRFTSRCPKAAAQASDAEHVARLKDALSVLRPAREKRFSYAGAPFPLLLYKRVVEWEKEVENAKSAALTPEDAGGADQPAGQPENQSTGQPVNKNAVSGTRENSAAGDDTVANNGGGNTQEIITVKMTRGEYNEIFHCVNKMETLLKKFA